MGPKRPLAIAVCTSPASTSQNRMRFFQVLLVVATVALASSEVAPHSLLFLSIGAGLLAGVAGSRVLLASKFTKT